MSDKKKIVLVGPYPPPMGGVSDSVRKLIFLFNKTAGCDGVILFNTSRGEDREDLYALKGFRSYYFSLILLFKLLALLIKERPGCVHVFVTSNSSFLRDALFLFSSRALTRKVFIHLHSKTQGEIFLNRGLLPVFCKVLRVADKVLVLSDFHRRFFSRYIPVDKLCVLENFCISEEFENSCGDGLSFLYVGRLSEKKGFFDLVDAICLVGNDEGKDIKVDVLGVSENESVQNEVIERCKPISSCIRLNGVVTGVDKKLFFKNTGCLVFPSHFENSPVVLKEAMQSNMLVVCSDIEANKNVLRDYPGVYYFRVGDSIDLAAAMRRVISITPSERKFILSECASCVKYDEFYAEAVLMELGC